MSTRAPRRTEHAGRCGYNCERGCSRFARRTAGGSTSTHTRGVRCDSLPSLSLSLSLSLYPYPYPHPYPYPYLYPYLYPYPCTTYYQAGTHSGPVCTHTQSVARTLSPAAMPLGSDASRPGSDAATSRQQCRPTGSDAALSLSPQQHTAHAEHHSAHSRHSTSGGAQAIPHADSNRRVWCGCSMAAGPEGCWRLGPLAGR